LSSLCIFPKLERSLTSLANVVSSLLNPETFKISPIECLSVRKPKSPRISDIDTPKDFCKAAPSDKLSCLPIPKDLLNGEQSDGSESTAVVGVDATADGFKEFDIDNVTGQLDGLGFAANTVIGSKANALQDLNQSLPNRDRKTLQSYSGLLRYDQYNLPDPDMVLIFDSRNAMRRMQLGGMKLETRRDPSRQTDEVFMSFFSGFYRQLRSSAVLLDKSVTFASTPFPSTMDYEARRLETFKSGF